MYSFAIYLYSLCAHIAALFSPKVRLMIRGQRAAWRVLRALPEGERYVWFHAASLGEFEQGRPLIERLRRERPDKKILLTFFSPSGYEVRKNYEGADVVCYLPFDTPFNARRFVRLARPEALYLIKYEFWRNYIGALYHASVPVYSVSSIFRPGQIFFRPYGRRYARCLRRVTRFFVQNAESEALLRDIGVTDVTVVGDTRFDRVIDIRRAARPLPLVEQFAGGAQVLVCGSTWPPDEDIILPYFNRRPDLKLVIAPHVVSEDHLCEIEMKLGRRAVRYSAATPETLSSAECLIIDCYGLLSAIYRYAAVAYVGGGFGVGIHNVPEAAVYGCPVIIGPNNSKFHEAQALLQCGGAREVHAAADFDRLMDHYLSSPEALAADGRAAGEYIHSHSGAADIISREIVIP